MYFSHKAKVFGRQYKEKWTKEIFIVVEQFIDDHVKSQHLIDLDGEDISGTFYKPELQKVDNLLAACLSISSPP